MRHFLLATAALGALASIGIPAPVQARDYPFCIKGAEYDNSVGDCSFDTYERCLATASGRKAYCDANPFFAYPKKPQFDYPKKQRRQY